VTLLFRYLAKEIVLATLLVLTALLALFALFDLIRELGEIGKGSYNLGQILTYVLLSLPSHVYVISPVAALIGTMFALSRLSIQSELTVMRTSGLSISRLSAFIALVGLGFAAARAHQAPTRRVLAQTALNGFIAMGVGMTLLLMALKKGDVGMVAILSSVSPVLVLPLLWLHLGRAPALAAWLGAALTVLGTALILSR